MNAPVRMNPTRSVPIVCHDSQPLIGPSEMLKTAAATPPVTSNPPATSSRWRPVTEAVAGMRTGVSSAAARPMGTFTHNTARQSKNCTRAPPSTRPATKPTDAVAP
jgi:hypothetical protein